MRARLPIVVPSFVTAFACALPFIAGCSNSNATAEPATTCIDAGVDVSCAPAYEATFDALYTNTLQRNCAAAGVSCHASTGRQGGVDFSAPEAAYTSLMKRAVRPNEPECSVLVQRVLSPDGKTRMPPGRSLSAGEQCAIVKWVATGAPR